MGFWDIAGKVALTAGKAVVYVAKEAGTALVDNVNQAKGMEKEYKSKSDEQLKDRARNGSMPEKMAAAREYKARQNK